ncbi:TlpA family protein disulfide reductase [Mucilaginibacter sp. S1162]|uniref:TlpA family protein disulfide reductase n=1 Tax=Mucilaginibacter humi TaxID=2732510 RepID=A0ABX1W270_9SPHI|nr:TlpA disulfide reductase family protein [Mucilaginibacter humi]NNU33095.1 TlpA family protein disulfide reductase [Mucilaginibacter humi]
MENKPLSYKTRSIFTVRNLLNGVFAAVIIILLISAPAKALLIKGLMKIGFFQPVLTSAKPVQPGSDLNFVNEKGQSLSLSSLKGKVVVINFWAPRCPPCIAEMSSINQLYLQLKPDTNIVILPVDADNNFGKSLPFMAKNKYVLPVYNTASQIPDVLFAGSLPTTIIIDRSGVIVFRHEGPADYTNKEFVKYLIDLSKTPVKK